MNDPRLNVVFDFDGKEERAGFYIPVGMFKKACQPVKESTESIGHILDMQSPSDNERILAERQEIAGFIAKDIAGFLMENVFSKMDTINGYPKM